MISPIRNLPSSWDVQTRANVKWRADLGDTSYGNPVIADGKIFVGTNNSKPRNTSVQGDKGILMCFRESDGQFLWQAVSEKLDSGPANDWPEQGVCSSPAVDGKRLYYVTNRGELVCLDTEGFLDERNDGLFQDEFYKSKLDADILWKLDMMKELGTYAHNMASSSPVVWKDLVFVETSNGKAENHDRVFAPQAPSFIAVDKHSGKIVWQDNSPGDKILHGQWASPALGEVNGIMQAIFPGGDGWVYGFNAATGEKLWQFDLNPKNAVWPKTRNYGVATPVFFENRIYVASGQEPENGNGPGLMYGIDPSKSGNITESGQIWHNDKIGRSISTAAVADGLVYISDFRGVLHCLDVNSGKSHWNYDMLAAVWGSPLLADGKIYLGDEDGDVVVFQAGTKRKKISEMNMGAAVYSTPVAANGVLYIMTRGELYAIANTNAGSKQ